MDGLAALATYRTQMQQRIGERHRRHLGIVDGRLIRRYALAIGEMNPIHHDEQAARAHGYAGLVAPPNLLSAVVEWGPRMASRAVRRPALSASWAQGRRWS